jgi:hypothetical protein
MTNSEEEKYDLIEQYIGQQLSPGEQEAFELEMSKDPELTKEVQAHLDARELILDQGILNVKSTLQNIHRAEQRKTDKSTNKYLLFAALLATIAASLLYLYFSSTKKTISSNNDTKSTIIDSSSFKKNTAAKSEEIKTTSNNFNKNIPVKENGTSNKNTPAASINNVALEKTDTTIITSEIKTTTDNTNTVIVSPNSTNQTGTIDCSAFSIQGEVNTSASCNDEATGNIIIQLNSIKGGTKPYKFSLHSEEDFRTVSQFSNLEAGQYKVFVQDKNNCIYEFKKVEIKSKNCPKEYAFAPDRGETWEIPIRLGTSGWIKLFNRTGATVYSSSITNGMIWNGNDNNGLSLPMGSYSFIINYDNGEIIQGQVTLLR